MSPLAFPFQMNQRPALAQVQTPEAVSLNFASHGVGLLVIFTLDEARAAIEALTQAVAAAEQIGLALNQTGGTA